MFLKNTLFRNIKFNNSLLLVFLSSFGFFNLSAQSDNKYFVGLTLIGNYNENFKTGISQPGAQLKFGRNIELTDKLLLEAGLLLQTSSLTYDKGLLIDEANSSTIVNGLSYLNASNYGLAIGVTKKVGKDIIRVGVLPNYSRSVFNSFSDQNENLQIVKENFDISLIEFGWRKSLKKLENLFLMFGLQYDIGKKDVIDSGFGKNIVLQTGVIFNFPL